jgi:DNA-binding CsgD family transcriptional regulator
MTRSVLSTPNASHLNNLPVLIQHALESLMDGIMLVSYQGELIFANRCAQRICRQFADRSAPAAHHPLSRYSAIPPQIWRRCQSLIESENSLSPSLSFLEDDIQTEASGLIRLRAQWLVLKMIDQPCLLVTLEDRQQSAQHKAIAEAQRYGLSERETQVWQLKRSGATYKAIAAALCISEDTVRKHIKSIHIKRDKVEQVHGFADDAIATPLLQWP